MPKISVILAVKNQSQYFKQAVKSITDQTFHDFEFIIIDDGSTEDIKKIINDFHDQRIIFLRNENNLGLTTSLNKALAKVQGKYVARMDADDIADKKRLEIQYSYLETNVDTAGCGTWAYLINNKNEKICKKKFPFEYAKIKKNIIKYNTFIHSSLMIRAYILKKMNYYNEKFLLSQDYDLVLKILGQYHMVNIPQYLMSYRVDIAGLSFKKMRASLFYSLKARLNAITKYHYPKWQIIYLIKPLISFLIPITWKKKYFRKNYKFEI